MWHYLQGGPGVFKGDLYFYRVDADLRDQMRRIDTRICPLYLLTGEYDFSCTPEDTIRTAEQIPGAEVVVMKEVGHFPMSENPRTVSPLHPSGARRGSETTVGAISNARTLWTSRSTSLEPQDDPSDSPFAALTHHPLAHAAHRN